MFINNMKTIFVVLVIVASLEIAKGQPNSGATASAVVVNGYVVGINITDGGFGYTSAPPIHIIGGGGSNAVVTAVVSNSTVTAITVDNPGIDYSTVPVVSIAPPVVSPPVLVSSPASYLIFTNLLGSQFMGRDYRLQENVAGVWTSVGPYIGSWSSSLAMTVDTADSDNTYLLALSPVPEQATAIAQVTNGFVVGATIINAGDGYSFEPPAVTISDGGGIGAQAVATTGVASYGPLVTTIRVLSITITNPGSGYTNTPSIVIGPPAAPLQLTSPPIINSMIRVDARGLIPYLNYQLQSSTDLKAWSNAAPSFIANNVTNSNHFFIDSPSDFFRAIYLP